MKSTVFNYKLGIAVSAMACAPLLAGGGVAFSSSTYEGVSDSDVGNARYLAACKIQLEGCNDEPEICHALLKSISGEFLAKGLVAMSKTEVAAAQSKHGPRQGPLYNLGGTCLVFKPQGPTTMKTLIEKINWIGSRKTGPTKGIMDEFYIVIFPIAKFANNSAFVRPFIGVYGSWHDVDGKVYTIAPNPISYCSYYNSTSLVGELRGVIQVKYLSQTIKALDAIAKIGADECDLRFEEWLKISSLKGYENKLPLDFLKKNDLFAGSGAHEKYQFFDYYTEVVAKGGYIQIAKEKLSKNIDFLSNKLKTNLAIAEDHVWPEGYDKFAALDATKIIIIHDKALLDLYVKMQAILNTL